MVVELVTQRPKHSYQPVERQIPKVFIEAVETVVEVPAIVQEEQPVEVPEVQVVECITQVSCPVVEFREKAVPSIQTQVVEREVQVPQLLQEEVCVVMPEIQVAEVIREEPNFREEIITKEIPRVQMEYIECVEEIYDRVEQTNVAMGLQSRQMGFQSRGAAVDVSRGLGVGMARALTAEVEYVSYGGVQLPFYQDHHLRTLSPVQLREHAMLLYRTLGHQTIGEMVPVGDHELYSWIMRVHGLHLEPLLVSGGLDASAVGAYGGARMLGNAGVVGGTRVVGSASGGTRMLGSGGIVGGSRVIGSALGASGLVSGASGGTRMLGSAGVVAGTGGSVGVRGVVGAGSVAASANVRAGAARVLGGGASAGLVARPTAGLMAGSMTDDLFNVVDRNHDGRISRSEFRSGLKGGIINRGPAAVLR